MDHISGSKEFARYGSPDMQIISQEKLPDGRSNILARCLYRVEIVDYFRPYSNDDYAIGEINSYEEHMKTIDPTIWKDLFESLLFLFKSKFDAKTQNVISQIAERETPKMSVEEVVNTLCQFSPLSIKMKIDLLNVNTIFDRARLLESYLT